MVLWWFDTLDFYNTMTVMASDDSARAVVRVCPLRESTEAEAFLLHVLCMFSLFLLYVLAKLIPMD